jgi:hypothetical protein
METFGKLENVDAKTIAKYLQKQSSKSQQTPQTNEQVPWESIDSPCTPNLSKISKRKFLIVRTNVRE